jgi:prepilin-type N-terminal cleavage/methylation domain-containing protein
MARGSKHIGRIIKNHFDTKPIMSTPRQRRSLGFTLIEILIVISIIGITVPIIVTLFTAVMRQQLQTIKLVQTKDQADFALNALKTTIRNNAFSLHSGTPPTAVNQLCLDQTTLSTPSQMVFEDVHQESFYFEVTDGVLASGSSVLSTSRPLTSDPVTISDLVISCSRPSFFAAPLIHISFTATHQDTRLGTTSLPFQTRISLRNQ